METIELDFDKKNELHDLSAAIRKGTFKFGSDPISIRLFISHGISDNTYAAYLIFLVEYFTTETASKRDNSELIKKNFEKQVSRLYHLYFGDYDVSKLEKSIEKAFKLNIEVEEKKPTDAVFGIWRNENITLAKIRKKAWQRTK